MKNLPLLFCGIFFALAFSFTGLILTSHIQIGSLTQTTESLEATDDLDENGMPVMVMTEGDPLYPAMPVGLAQQGKEIYISMGCMYCHSQQVRRNEFGADIERGWGPRQTVARDYILQERVLLGTMRTGPDLAHLGGRYAGDAGRDWNHLHLYNPQIVSKGSTMPPFASFTTCDKLPINLPRRPSHFHLIPSMLQRQATRLCRLAVPKHW